MTTDAPALLTDFYQVTMACAHWQRGAHLQRASFSLGFRRAPFGGAYAVAAGIDAAVDHLTRWAIAEDELDFLAAQVGNDGRPLFPAGFLSFLRGQRFTGDVFAVQEGTAVFPGTPMMRVEGPLWLAQWVETPLLTLVNFHTLIATKAARVVTAAAGDPVFEFGLRRAQGFDGGLSATRAAFVGGIHGTSNAHAARLLGVPARGTHAHAWVMAHDDEAAAFHAWADAMPNNATFLVDTWDTLTGVDRAIAAAHRLRAAGHRPVGIRLDSGDLLSLSREARRRLDAAGLPEMAILASDDLDEHRIAALKAAGAPISAWGVGTRLVTGHDQPALGGVYKLGALEGPQGWVGRVKRSDNPTKISDPGRLQVRRTAGPDGLASGDTVYAIDDGPPDVPGTDLLLPQLRGGTRLRAAAHLLDAAAHARESLRHIPEIHRSLSAPEAYPVARTPSLLAARSRLLAAGATVPA